MYQNLQSHFCAIATNLTTRNSLYKARYVFTRAKKKMRTDL